MFQKNSKLLKYVRLKIGSGGVNRELRAKVLLENYRDNYIDEQHPVMQDTDIY